MSRIATSLRFLVSALLAGALLLFGGGWLVHHYVGHRPAQTVGLKVIQGIQYIGHLPHSGTSTPPKKQEPMLTGFVQVAFTVGADGRAHDIHVLRAEPPGEYEEAAREIIAARRFKPQASGKGAAAKRTQVVHFQVPASTLEKKNKGGPQPDS